MTKKTKKNSKEYIEKDSKRRETALTVSHLSKAQFLIGNARYKYRLFPAFHLQKSFRRFLYRGEAAIMFFVSYASLPIGWLVLAEVLGLQKFITNT
jgi:hypothetical protein